MTTEYTNDGLRISRQDLSAASPTSDDDHRMFHHDGTGDIPLVSGSTTSETGYYVWNDSEGAWRSLQSEFNGGDYDLQGNALTDSSGAVAVGVDFLVPEGYTSFSTDGESTRTARNETISVRASGDYPDAVSLFAHPDNVGTDHDYANLTWYSADEERLAKFTAQKQDNHFSLYTRSEAGGYDGSYGEWLKAFNIGFGENHAVELRNTGEVFATSSDGSLNWYITQGGEARFPGGMRIDDDYQTIDDADGDRRFGPWAGDGNTWIWSGGTGNGDIRLVDESTGDQMLRAEEGTNNIRVPNGDIFVQSELVATRSWVESNIANVENHNHDTRYYLQDEAAGLEEPSVQDTEWFINGALQFGQDPATRFTETNSPTSFEIDATEETDLFEGVTVELSNSTGDSVTEDVTVDLYWGTDTSGTPRQSITKEVTVADGFTGSIEFSDDREFMNDGTYVVEVSTTDLTVDQTEVRTAGATQRWEQNSRGELRLRDQYDDDQLFLTQPENRLERKHGTTSFSPNGNAPMTGRDETVAIRAADGTRDALAIHEHADSSGRSNLSFYTADEERTGKMHFDSDNGQFALFTRDGSAYDGSQGDWNRRLNIGFGAAADVEFRNTGTFSVYDDEGSRMFYHGGNHLWVDTGGLRLGGSYANIQDADGNTRFGAWAGGNNTWVTTANGDGNGVITLYDSEASEDALLIREGQRNLVKQTLSFQDAAQLEPIPEPPAADSGYRLYTDEADGNLKAKDDAGNVTTIVS